ncbi:SMP-30/gluconolactonase/LRE family protein [Catenulispora sp. GP43]|uniref:SMP-30/gluconolactonase/LRE family protein n=1 Tax=Catenulispora sp. GP43 TaxID=3156263 RepID=UPI0035174BED
MAAAVAATAVSVIVSGSAMASSPPVSSVRIADHFNLAAGQMPENITLDRGGAVDLSFSAARQIARIGRDGKVSVLATLPGPADGGVNTPVLHFALSTGLVRTEDGTFYVLEATGTDDLTGLWRVRPGDTPERIAALPGNGLPNGLARDETTGDFYVTDSVLGVIWRIPAVGGPATVWASGPELASTGFLGANGLKVHNGAVWASNLDKGTIVRYPIGDRGRAGTPQIAATGLGGIDDFEFIGHDDRLLATLNPSNEVALVRPDGSHTIVLTAQDGLSNPTSVAVRGNTFYVASAAYVTQKDPNLLTGRINPRH